MKNFNSQEIQVVKFYCEDFDIGNILRRAITLIL